MKTLVFFLLLLNNLAAAAMTIEVAIDRNPVSVNESFEATFTASDTPDGEPDFSPLNQDFTIVSQNQSNQSTWINGKASQTLQWTLQLMAKHAGNIVIPAISFGRDSTNPLTLNITAQTSDNAIDTDKDLFLKVEASPHNPYIQSQVLYTLRLYRRVNLTQASLGDPSLPEAVIQKLGDDSNYTTQLNGVDYAVTERKYAIFPQKSGNVTIPALSLTAEILASRQPRFNGFFSQQATQTKQIASEPINLEVRPAPNLPKVSNWLPAEDVQLKQEWSGDINQMKVGEPLTRTLSLLAKGATVGLLPELKSNASDPHFKSYPDQPTLKEMPKPEGIYALREEKIALIPNQSGTISLPAIEVPWFNVKTQQLEIAKIPATLLKVTGGNTATQNTVTQNTPSVTQSVATIPSNPEAVVTQTNNLAWRWVALFLGLGWFTTTLYFLSRKRLSTVKPISASLPSKKTNYPEQLKQACQSNDMQLTKQILVDWGQSTFNVNTLGALATCCDARLRDEIVQLNQLLYAPENREQHWQGKRLLQAFNEQSVTQKFQRSQDDGLEPLYRL